MYKSESRSQNKYVSRLYSYPVYRLMEQAIRSYLLKTENVYLILSTNLIGKLENWLIGSLLSFELWFFAFRFKLLALYDNLKLIF